MKTPRSEHPNCTPGHHRVVALVHVTATAEPGEEHLFPLEEEVRWTERFTCELRAKARLQELAATGFAATAERVGR